MSVSTFDPSALKKKSRDEMKLNFHNTCLEKSRKYRMSELTNSQKEFKRKYSWCIPGENNSSRHSLSNTTSRGGNSRNTSNRSGDGGVSDTRSKSRSFYSPVSATSSSTPDSDDCGRPPCTSRESTESQQVVSLSTKTGVAIRDFPVLLDKRTSLRDVETKDRVNYLQDLWNKVFPADSDNFSNSRHIERKKNLASRDVYTSLVMNQFNDRRTDTRSTKLPLIAQGLCEQQSRHSVTDINISKPKVTPQNLADSDKGEGEDICPKASVNEDERDDTEETIGLGDLSKDEAQDGNKPQVLPNKERKDTRQQATTLNSEVRRKSMNIQILKPPFQNFVGRTRSHSMDSTFAGVMWRSSIFNVLMNGQGKKRFPNCVMAAVNKGRVKTHQGQKWRREMRKCRYLRIPECSLSPVNSDSEPES